jgi:hypothetical protein
MSFVQVGKQNRIDLSWNAVINNGYTIKNYFFYEETNANDALRRTISYYSYSLPMPNNGRFLSSTGDNTGFDINRATSQYSIILNSGFPNYFDLMYGGEIEISWLYHSDVPILDICSNFASSTSMDISIIKTDTNNNSIILLNNTRRVYESYANKLGAIPINNGVILKDTFSMTIDPTIVEPTLTSEIKHFKKDDTISVYISFSSLSYIPYYAAISSDTRQYSIILKDITFAPYRIPFSQRYTSLPFGDGANTGFKLTKNNALDDLTNTGGAIYYMPKMTNPMKTYENAKISISWMYDFDLSLSPVDLSNIYLTDISNIILPYRLKIRGYSRPFTKTSSAITDSNYNTSIAGDFILNTADTINYNTYPLFVYDVSYNVLYSDIKKDASNNRPVMSATIDLSGLTFPVQTVLNDHSHTQLVFICTLYLDTSLRVYDVTYSNIYNLFNVCLRSYTFTPYQYYRFSSPDPILAISNAKDGSFNTVYSIINPYLDIPRFYSLYNLTNGTYYGYKLAANNIFGTSPYSSRFVSRCGSAPNRVFGGNYNVESYSQRNQITVMWDRPSFSGYEINGYRLQYVLDVSGRWINLFDYTADIHPNNISFNMFSNIDISNSIFETGDERYSYITRPSDITDVTAQIAYRFLLRRFNYLNSSLAIQYGNGDISGALINGSKYYIKIAAMNTINDVLTAGEYSPILSGVSITYPDDSGVTFPISGENIRVVGDKLIIFSWIIPTDDGGGPILDYLIEFATVSVNSNGDTITDSNGNSITSSYTQYYEDSYQPRDKLEDYKYIRNNKDSTNPLVVTSISQKTANLNKYHIPPTPIILYNVDRYSASNTEGPLFSNSLIIKNSNTKYTYTSYILYQNEFDLSNIQLKWYYIKDPTSGNWTSQTNINFKISISGYLTDNNNLNKIQIFSLPSTADISYNATNALLSDASNSAIGFRYINHLTGDNLNLDPVNVTETPRIKFSDITTIDSSFSTALLVKNKNTNYSYISSPLTQTTNFYLKNIQLKWYYTKDLSGLDWDSNTNINYKLSIRGFLSDLNGENRNEIFSIPSSFSSSSYDVSFSKLSSDVSFNYIDYLTGNIIQNGGTPIIPISKIYEINSSKRLIIDVSATNLSHISGAKFNVRFAPIILSGTAKELYRINEFRKLVIDVSATNLTNGNGAKMNIYFAPVIINGIAPVRTIKTNTPLKTRFTYTIKDLSNNGGSEINNLKYSFRVRPFNISDYFLVANKFEETLGISNASPITDISYVLYSDGGGGSVKFIWKYPANTLYYFKLTIPSEYSNESSPNEYLISSVTQYSFKTPVLSPLSSSDTTVTYTIPSIIPADILSNNVQLRLTNGRAYTVNVAPIKEVIINGAYESFVAPYVSYNFIVPFITPQRPFSLSAYSGNSTIQIIVKLPNIASDPNYYTTFDIENSYYQYKTYLVEYKVVSSDAWLSIPEITIPANSYAGQETSVNITGVLNDTTDISGTSYNIRVKLSIKNNDNSQIAYSQYTYLTNINNILYSENVNNLAYASLFPTKPSTVSSLNIWKISASNNQIGMTWTTPIINGNAAFYYYEYYYSLNTIDWYNVYDVTNGIAINTGTNLAGPSSLTTNISTLITFTLTSTSNIQRYSLRLRVTGYNTVDSGGNPVLNPILTRQAISDWSEYSTIIL